MSDKILLNDKIFHENIHFLIHRNENVDLDHSHLRSTLHWHSHFELEIIESGSAIHLFNGSSYHLERGSAYIVTPSDFHTIRPEENHSSISLYSIQFDNTAIPIDLCQLLIASPIPFAKFREEEFGTILVLLKKLSVEKNKKHYKYEYEIRYLFGCLLIEYFRNCLSQNQIASGLPNLKGNSIIRESIVYIKNNFKSGDLNVNAIANHFNLSPNYFSNIFKKEMNKTCNSYIKELRLSFAEGLLRNSDIPVNQIALESGFLSPSYFTKDFREKYGMTPSEFHSQNFPA